MRLVAIALTALLAGSEQFAPAAPQLARAAVVRPISIRVGGPARTGLQIWVFADLQGPLTARYPYGEDPRGTELAGLVYHLINTYGEAAIPYIQRALAESPYVWVRTQSAEQLALKGRVEAFRFFLDATTANRSYRSELENWLRVTFHLPANNATDRVDQRNGEPALLAFLNQRIRDPKPPPEDSSIRAAVARLQSADLSDRKAAAQILLDLAPQRQEYTINVSTSSALARQRR